MAGRLGVLVTKKTSKGDTTGAADRLLSQMRQVHHFFGNAVGYEVVTGYVMPYGFSVSRTAKGDWLCTVRGTDGQDAYVYFAAGATPWDSLVKASVMAFLPKTEWKPDRYAQGTLSLELVGAYEAAKQRAERRYQEQQAKHLVKQVRQTQMFTATELVGAEGTPSRDVAEDGKV